MRKRYRRVRHKPQYLWSCKCGWQGIRTSRTATTKECPKCNRVGSMNKLSADIETQKKFTSPTKIKKKKQKEQDPPPGFGPF